MGIQDPMDPEYNPNLYDRTKYSMVLDENTGGQMPPQYAGGTVPREYRGGARAPQPYPGAGVSPNPGRGMPQQPYGGYNPNVNPNRGGMMNSQGIAATIQELERMRQSINARNLWGIIALVIGMVAPIMIAMGVGRRSGRSGSGFAGLVPFLTVGGMIVAFLIMQGGMRTKKKMKALYKETFVRQMLQEHFQDVYYNWEQGMEQILIKNSGVCRLGNRFYSEDYLNAVYRGIRFQQADVTIQYHTSGKNSHTTTYFQGRMFCFEYPMKQSLAVQIHSKRFIYAGMPASGVNKKALQLESVDFNRDFVVRAAMEHDAFYILTPQMMERIRMLQNKYGSITMTFDRGYLMVGLNSRMDSFDANLRKPIDYPSERLRMQQDVEVIEELIQILQCIPS